MYIYNKQFRNFEEDLLIKLGLQHYDKLSIIQKIWFKEVISFDIKKAKHYGIDSVIFLNDFKLLKIVSSWKIVINCFIYKMEIIEGANFYHKN